MAPAVRAALFLSLALPAAAIAGCGGEDPTVERTADDTVEIGLPPTPSDQAQLGGVGSTGVGGGGTTIDVSAPRTTVGNRNTSSSQSKHSVSCSAVETRAGDRPLAASALVLAWAAASVVRRRRG
jgi:hypothetical protein